VNKLPSVGRGSPRRAPNKLEQSAATRLHAARESTANTTTREQTTPLEVRSTHRACLSPRAEEAVARHPQPGTKTPGYAPAGPSYQKSAGSDQGTSRTQARAQPADRNRGDERPRAVRTHSGPCSRRGHDPVKRAVRVDCDVGGAVRGSKVRTESRGRTAASCRRRQQRALRVESVSGPQPTAPGRARTTPAREALQYSRRTNRRAGYPGSVAWLWADASSGNTRCG